MASITGIGLTTLNIFSPMFTFGGLSGGVYTPNLRNRILLFSHKCRISVIFRLNFFTNTSISDDGIISV